MMKDHMVHDTEVKALGFKSLDKNIFGIQASGFEIMHVQTCSSNEVLIGSS